MDKSFEIDIDLLFPSDERDADRRRLALSAEAFLVENPVSATLSLPGTADDTRRRVAEMGFPSDPGSIRRALILYDAWLAFYRGDISAAKAMAFRLFDDIGLQESMLSPGNPGGGAGQLQKLGAAYLISCLVRYGASREIVDKALACLSELRGSGSRAAQAAEIHLAMYEMSIGIMSDVPAWIRSGDLGVARIEGRLAFYPGGVQPENLYSSMIAAVQYATYRNDHVMSLELLDKAERVLGMRGYVIGDIYLALHRAICYGSLGYPDDAEAHFAKAVRLAAPDGLWQPISEHLPWFDEHFPELAATILPRDAERRCRALLKDFASRVKDTHQEEKDLRGHRNLTNQEQAVMELASKGLKISEIAAELHIEPVTVKFHKKNAYAKLGVNGQTDIKEALRRHDISAPWIKE